MDSEPFFIFDLLPPPPPPPPRPNEIDLTPYLMMPQTEVAKQFGIPLSTFSKRWKKAGRGRKWPYRKVMALTKLDQTPELIRKRKRLLAPVKMHIHVNNTGR
jgi:hypothetical protein